jgi:hypothetical protein
LLCPLNDTIIRNGTFNGRPGILNSPDSLLKRYVIILVSIALKTVTVANANGFFNVLSVTRPEMLPFCALTSTTKKINREVNKIFFINVSYGKGIVRPAGWSCCFLKEYLIRENYLKSTVQLVQVISNLVGLAVSPVLNVYRKLLMLLKLLEPSFMVIDVTGFVCASFETV